MEDKSLGSFTGLGVGDALGAPVEFLTEGSFAPVTDYQPATRFSLNAGEWTDDTIMAFCLAEALIEKDGYDSFAVMNKYKKWVDTGYNSPNGRLFDIGIQTRTAMYEYSYDPLPVAKTTSAGNGTIMRLAPAVVATMSSGEVEAGEVFEISARDTHNSCESVEATTLFGYILRNLINGETFDEGLSHAKKQTEEYMALKGYPSQRIAERTYNFSDKEAHNGFCCCLILL